MKTTCYYLGLAAFIRLQSLLASCTYLTPRVINIPVPMLRLQNSFLSSSPGMIQKTRKLGPIQAKLNGLEEGSITFDYNKYLTDADKKQFTVEQLRFLARKRRFKAGEGPAMPEECTCATCKGVGIIVCHQCGGTGVNDRNIEQVMGNELENIVVRDNGVVNVLWFFQKNGPCWYCRGDPNCPCRDCEGTGFSGFKSIMYNGD
mmetsp:Transcript_12285/g.30019  ORF Transcript_12285/g.30019 Transcript_12285/m.30019 type:complete len:203 (+) Transcript_12285:1-609(+)